MKNFLFSPSYSNGTSATNHFLRQVVLGFILVFTFSFQAHAIHIWTGAVNNDWHNTGNWNPASIPSSLDFVSIPNFTNIPEVKFGNTAVCSGIEIANDATFKIQANAFVEINASISDAIKNNGILDNSGTILLGAVTAING
jgi:hypothetical protein